MSDWYARKLGQQQPQQPQQVQHPHNYPPVAPRAPGQPAAPIPAPGHQQAPQVPPEHDHVAPAAPDGQMHIGDAIRVWKGGEGHRKETQRCPDCGSDHFFTRSGSGIMGAGGRLVQPAPICMTCGWNGLFEQALAPDSAATPQHPPTPPAGA